MSVSTESDDVKDWDLSQPSPQDQEDKSSSVQGLSVQTVGQSASSSVDEGEERVKIMQNSRKEKTSLLHTKSYLMNSLLHLQDRNKILLQLSKQNNLDRQSRNIYHGKIYNYVLPAPRVAWTNKKQVML